MSITYHTSHSSGRKEMRVAREPENLNIPAARLLVLTTMIIGLILGIVHAFEHDRNIQLQIDAGEIPRHRAQPIKGT